jgi:hypothetical protein
VRRILCRCRRWALATPTRPSTPGASSEHHQRRTACRPRLARDRSRRLPKAALGQRCAAKLTAPECAAARQLLPASASVVILLVVQLDQERKQLVRQILGRLMLLAEHGADPLLNHEVRRPHPRRRLRFRGIVTVMKAHGSSPAASTVRRDNDISARIVPGTRKSNTDGAVPLRHLLCASQWNLHCSIIRSAIGSKSRLAAVRDVGPG